MRQHHAQRADLVPETFTFLGFAFICAKSRQGKVPAQLEASAGPHPGEAQRSKGGVAKAEASAYP
jgi:hypothetical protein